MHVCVNDIYILAYIYSIYVYIFYLVYVRDIYVYIYIHICTNVCINIYIYGLRIFTYVRNLYFVHVDIYLCIYTSLSAYICVMFCNY